MWVEGVTLILKGPHPRISVVSPPSPHHQWYRRQEIV